MDWHNAESRKATKYKCGHCDTSVAAALCYRSDEEDFIKICPYCDRPTYFGRCFKTGSKIRVPNIAPGDKVEHLPVELENLYNESRKCVSVSAYTASVLTCRKLLMNIAVTQGANEGKNFITYVEYLSEKGFIPPNGRRWVDHIRKKGNEAAHEIALMKKEDAEELISFSEITFN